MEPKKLTTIIHGKANRIRHVLIYAVLEWTLIFFLLLNSLFSYLILKFALYFGLKPPCPLCSRLDHIFKPHNSEPFFICEQHSAELSKSTQKGGSDSSFTDEKLMCCCCGASAKPTQKRGFDLDHPQHLEFYIDNDDYGWREIDGELVFEPHGKHNSDSVCLDFLKFDEPNAVVRFGETKTGALAIINGAKVETLASINGAEEVAVAREIDEAKVETLASICEQVEEQNEEVAAAMISDEVKIETSAMINGPEEDLNEEVVATVRSDEAKTKTSATISGPKEGLNEEYAAAMKPNEAKIEPLATLNGPEEDGNEEFAGNMNSDEAEIETLATIANPEEDLNGEMAAVLMSDEAKIETLATITNPEDDLNEEMAAVLMLDEVKIDTLATINGPEGEIAVTLISDKAKIEDLVIEVEMKEEVDSDDKSKSEIIPITHEQAEEIKREIYLEDSGVLYHKESDEVGIENGRVDLTESSTTNTVCGASNGACALLENGHYDGSKKTNVDEGDTEKENGFDEVEEERIPDTPTSIDSLHLLQRRLLSIGRTKTSTEGSIEDGVVNDNGYGDEEESIEELKSKLRAERKAFNALFEELEEERNAAAISASQTMAMINRLQEEKAAIEMEALQYHRMMEEQAEYDHEALQLMNEILVKRENEKEELERELEACTNKLMAYEEKDVSFPVSCTNEADVVADMKDSLSCFEEERISILEQLKVLEENLCALADEEEHQIRNLNSIEQIYTNGEREMNGSKALVSENEFFDEDGGYRLDPFLLDGLPLTQFGSEKRRFTIEEEVERLYERLNALEEDKEFIKNCLGSLRKGDRGIHLLQEILQHLRDLKSAEFRARNVC